MTADHTEKSILKTCIADLPKIKKIVNNSIFDGSLGSAHNAGIIRIMAVKFVSGSTRIVGADTF